MLDPGGLMFVLPLTDDAELRPLEPWRAEEFLGHLDHARDHEHRDAGRAHRRIGLRAAGVLAHKSRL